MSSARQIIAAEVERQRGIAFTFDAFNCGYFAGDLAKALIGRDPVAHLRDKFKDEKGALKLFRKNGWANLGDAAASIFPEIPLAQAHTGDWVYFETGTDAFGALGVVVAAQAVARSRDGIGLVSLSIARRAFRVA